MRIFDFFRKKCVIGGRKRKQLRPMNDLGQVIKVCIPCSEYAERRA